MLELKEFALLKKHGFRLLPYGLAKDVKQAVEIAERIGYPVALKGLVVGVTHKTDIGAVKIGIRNHIALKLAYKELMENMQRHGATASGVLVQKMARKGVELIIGGKRDPQFGYMVVLGLGGVYVEVFRDITARICPITKRDVDEMVKDLQAHPLLLGARGQKPIYLKGLQKLMIATCRFLVKEKIKELDLNPVIFDEKGYDIVDARFTADKK